MAFEALLAFTGVVLGGGLDDLCVDGRIRVSLSIGYSPAA